MAEGGRTFTVVVGDLVRSRDIKDRSGFSRRIRSSLGSVSKRFKRELYAPLVLTRGIDELSGVLGHPAVAYRICKTLNEEMHPQLIRFAVVRGHLDVGVRTRDARKMDGPAFHQAAELVLAGKRYGRLYSFRIGGPCPNDDACLTELANLIHLMQDGWSDHQREVVRLYERLGRQEAVADRLKISQQAVSDALRLARWKELTRAEKSVELILAGM